MRLLYVCLVLFPGSPLSGAGWGAAGRVGWAGGVGGWGAAQWGGCGVVVVVVFVVVAAFAVYFFAFVFVVVAASRCLLRCRPHHCRRRPVGRKDHDC